MQYSNTIYISGPKYRSIFSFPYFNVIQSQVMDDVLYTGMGKYFVK